MDFNPEDVETRITECLRSRVGNKIIFGLKLAEIPG